MNIKTDDRVAKISILISVISIVFSLLELTFVLVFIGMFISLVGLTLGIICILNDYKIPGKASIGLSIGSLLISLVFLWMYLIK